MNNIKPMIQFICSGKRLLYISWNLEHDSRYRGRIKLNVEVENPEAISNAVISTVDQILETINSIQKEPCKSAEQQWIPVTERLPEVSEKVIVCRKGGKVEQGMFLGVNGWWKVYGTNTKAVTHWMPLPDAPKDGE